MPVPQEVDDLERLISGLTQEIAKKRSNLNTLQGKITVSNEHLERCKKFRDICMDGLRRFKSKQVVPLSDYKGMVNLYQNNQDSIIRYQLAISSLMRDKAIMEQELPQMEAAIQRARLQLSQWGLVIPLRP